ncbi:MAG: AAA family ATPase [Bacillota bacterium]|nr:AAA family ATPase [Bacillota bacterium]
MGKVIVIASGKGGTGKSTVTVGLGLSLVRNKKKVLLVDCDSGMRGLDIMLGIEKKLVFDISDLVSGACNIDSAVYPCPDINNLSLIAAPLNAHDELSPFVFKKLIDSLRENYDYIIIDSPGGVGKGFEVSFFPADAAIIVSNAEPTSLRGCVNVKRKLLNHDFKDIRLVINRFSKAKFIKMGFYEDLDNVIDVAETQLIGIIPDDIKTASMIQKGHPNDVKSSAFENLAKRVQGQNVPLNLKILK